MHIIVVCEGYPDAHYFPFEYVAGTNLYTVYIRYLNGSHYVGLKKKSVSKDNGSGNYSADKSKEKVSMNVKDEKHVLVKCEHCSWHWATKTRNGSKSVRHRIYWKTKTKTVKSDCLLKGKII